MHDITIDQHSAQIIGETCEAIAVAAGAGPLPAALIGCGAALAARLTDAGYECASLETLRAKVAEVAALPPLTEFTL